MKMGVWEYEHLIQYVENPRMQIFEKKSQSALNHVLIG